MLNKKAKGLADVLGYYPMMATIVTSRHRGTRNAMAVAWHAIVSMKPPAYGVSISPKRFTHDLISKSRKFAVNFMPAKEAELIAAVGGCSGRDMDKFEEFGIEESKPLVLDVPILKHAYLAIECKVFSKLRCGDHDWFVGDVVATHWSGEAFDKSGHVRLRKATPVAYLGFDHYLAVSMGRTLHLVRKDCISHVKRKASRHT